MSTGGELELAAVRARGGANAISTMRAALLIGILAALGALTQGGAITETVGAGLIDGVAITSLAATAGLLTASGFMPINQVES